MRHGGIQDESSEHKHPTVHEQNISDACGAQYTGRCEHRKRHMKRVYSQTRTATASRQTRSGLLSSPRRRQLDRVVITMNEHTASMTKALVGARNSKFIDPVFMQQLVAVKDNLEAATVAVKTYIEQNEENGTSQLKVRASLQVTEARKWFTYLDKILAMERAEV